VNDDQRDRLERNIAYGAIVISIILVVLCGVAFYFILGRHP
jgi:hypothetical protein